jgi:hypothetical protein
MTDRNTFFSKVRARLASDETFQNFIRFFQFPHAGTDLANSIWLENDKVFSADDKLLLYVRGESQGDPDLNILHEWEHKIFESYKYSPNSIWVFDTQQSIVQVRPGQVVEVEHEGAKITRLVYNSGGYEYSYTEGNFYRTSEENGTIEQLPVYYQSVPAFFVSSRFLDKSANIRTNILGGFLTDFEDFLYNTILSKINDSFGHLNIIERISPAEGCAHETAHERCVGGYLESKLEIASTTGESYQEQTAYVYDVTGARALCPVCRAMPTIGGLITIPMHRSKDFETMPHAVRFVSPDVTALEYSAKKLADTRQHIYDKATGSSNMLAESALNSELAVLYAMDSARAILRQIQKDIYENVVRSAEIYGEMFYQQGYKSVSVTLGDNYMLSSRSEMIALKEKTDPLGLSAALGIDMQLTRYAGDANSPEARRAWVIIQLVYVYGAAQANKIVALFEAENQNLSAMNMQKEDIFKNVVIFATNNKAIIEPREVEPKNENE